MTHIAFRAFGDDAVRASRGFFATEEPAGAGLGPVVLMPRRIPGGVAATLDGLGVEALPRLHHEGSAADLRRALRAVLSERLPRPRWLANWLLDDVLDKAALMVGLTGASALRARLDVEGGAPDATFAIADAPLRLITSYRGPGVEWVPTGPCDDGRSGPAHAAATRLHLPRGHVAILRGRAGGGAGVPHRAAVGDGAPVLRLTVEEIGCPAAAVRRRPRLQPPNIRSSTASQSRST